MSKNDEQNEEIRCSFCVRLREVLMVLSCVDVIRATAITQLVTTTQEEE